MVYRKYREIKQWGKTNARIFKKAAKINNQVPKPKFDIPEAVRAYGAVIHDPNDPSFFQQFEPLAEIPEIIHPAFKQTSIKNHPLYNSKTCRLFESLEPFSDGVDQVCDLLKAIKIDKLPESIVNIDHSILRNTAEDDVKDCIMHGERYDPTLEKLEKRHDKILFWVNHPIVYGTPVIKRNNIILEALYRKVILSAVKEGKLSNLRCDRDQYISSILNNVGFNERPLVIRGQPHLFVQSDQPLKLLADKTEIESSIDQKVPDVSPISPFIDLGKSNLYNTNALVPRSMIPNLYVDTVLFARQQSQKYPWTTEQNAANAIMTTFGAALSQATRNMTYDQISQLTTLKEPVITKGIQLVDGKFDFVAIQVNTLDLSSKNGIKNFVWYEKAVPFYKPKPYWENMDTVEELNINAFHRFASMLLKR